MKIPATKSGNFVKLWENPNPNQSFTGEQYINLPNTDFDYLILICKNEASGNTAMPSVIAPKGVGMFDSLAFRQGGTNYSIQRGFTFPTTDYSKIYVGKCWKNDANDDSYIIPLLIIGVKYH